MSISSPPTSARGLLFPVHTGYLLFPLIERMPELPAMWDAFSSITECGPPAVIPVLVGPLQALLAILPGILVALGGLLLAMFKPSALKRGLQLLWAQKKMAALVALCAGGLVYARYTLFAA